MVKCNTPPRALVVGQIFMFHMLTTPLEKKPKFMYGRKLDLVAIWKEQIF